MFLFQNRMISGQNPPSSIRIILVSSFHPPLVLPRCVFHPNSYDFSPRASYFVRIVLIFPFRTHKIFFNTFLPFRISNKNFVHIFDYRRGASVINRGGGGHKIPYILESNPHPNLIRTSFCQFFK